MKRSEMVAIIAEALPLYDMGGEKSSYSYEEAANEILAKIEAACMMPPRNLNATFEEQYNNRTLYFWEKE
jgi:hypothetical protein